MSVLSIPIVIFVLLEASNVILLYFKPESKLGNGIGVFKAWEESKSNAKMHEFIKYLVYWVAGTKLIFIALLIVIVFTADETTKLLTVIALVLSIASFYWKLFPIIKRLDKMGELVPPGYSITLGTMIGGFISVFCLFLLLEVIS